MKILVINSGSSSIKFQLLDMEDESVLASGLVERIGETNSLLKCVIRPDRDDEVAVKRQEPVADHRSGMLEVVRLLTAGPNGVVQSKSEIEAIGHRVVHGGEDFHEPIIIDDRVIAAIKNNIALAPLHNPANLDGITGLP